MKRISISILKFSIIIFFATVFLVATGISSDKTGKTIWSFSSFGDSDFFHMPSDIEVDQKLSLIYLADTGNHRIAVFDFNGKFSRSIGSEGQGPGEFSRPTGIFILPDGGLAVADYNNHRIQIFNQAGDFVRSIITKDAQVADLIVFNDTYYTVSTYGASGFRLNMGTQEKSIPLVSFLNEQGEKTGDISIDDFQEKQPFIRAIKHRVCLTLSSDNKFFLPFFGMNLIQVFDLKGNKITEFERPLPFKPIVPKLEQQRTSGNVIQMRASLDKVSQDAEFGPDGRLYILTYKESLHKLMKDVSSPEKSPLHPMRIDVIDPQTYKVENHFECDPNTFAFAWIDKNRIVYIHEDEAGELIFKCVHYQ